jgi:hypothetical protein
MVGLPSPQGSGAWRIRIAWLAAAVIVLSVALTLLLPMNRAAHGVASGVGLFLGGLGVTVASSYQALRSDVRRRTRAWALFALAAGLGTAGNIALLIAGTSMGPTAGISPSDACLMLSLLVGVVGVITFPATPRRPAEMARILMDGVIMGGSALFFASLTLFPRSSAPAATSTAGRCRCSSR